MISRRTVAALPLLALALTGCGGSDLATARVSAERRASADPRSGAATASPTPTPNTAQSPAGGAARPGSGQPVAAGQGLAGQPGAVAQSGTVAQPRAAGPSGVADPGAAPSSFTPPGAYSYDRTGTVTALGSTRDASGTSTLTVSGPSGTTQHSVLSDGEETTTQDVTVRADGSYLSRLELSTAGFDKTFAPSPAVLLLPSPANPGSSWTWTATSTDGKTTVTAKNTVLRTETLTVGGEQVATTVIRTVLALRGTDLTYDGAQDTWFAPAERLPVKLHNTGHGNASGAAFSTDTTSTARSSHPS